MMANPPTGHTSSKNVFYRPCSADVDSVNPHPYLDLYQGLTHIPCSVDFHVDPTLISMENEQYYSRYYLSVTTWANPHYSLLMKNFCYNGALERQKIFNILYTVELSFTQFFY
jgi:hypothetical protein